MKSAYIRLGDFKYPDQNYEVNFAENDYHRLYNEYLRCTGKQLDFDTGAALNYNDFKELYPMVCFEVSNKNENLFTGNVVSLRIHMEFSGGATPADDFTVYTVIFSERELVMDVVQRKIHYSVQ